MIRPWFSCPRIGPALSMNIAHLAQELAAHLVLTRPLVCFDLEATGLAAERDRIVQIATARVFPDGRVETWSSLVNPEQPIPADTIAVHGITDVMAASAPTFAQLAPTLITILTDCDLAGYNIDKFDRRLLAAEFRRASLTDPTVGSRSVDAYTIFVRQESRGLDAALAFYDIDLGDTPRRAHEASSDVEATLAVLAAQVKAYPDVPRTVDGIADWLNPPVPNRIDANGRLVWRNDVAVIGFGAQAGASLVELASTDRGFLEWMLRKDFSDEVKTIIREALAGRFPARSDAPSP